MQRDPKFIKKLIPSQKSPAFKPGDECMVVSGGNPWIGNSIAEEIVLTRKEPRTLVRGVPLSLFILLMFLSGCVITASSGTRTEYEDKMKQIEKDYHDMKITKNEYNRLQDRALQQGKASQKNDSVDSGQSYP